MRLPQSMHWMFWDVDPRDIDLRAHVDFVLARVLETGRLTDIRWLVEAYGLEEIHRFFRHADHPEISAPTREFWRAVLAAGDERWEGIASWRNDSSIPWPS